LDRNALVLRNRRMAEAFHALPFRHHVRRAMLRAIAEIPIPRYRARGVERILLVRPDHLGDVLLTTPAIHALRKAKPRAELHALVGPWSAEALATNPDLDSVITLPFPGFSRSPKKNLQSPYELALRSARQLRVIGYTSAVIFRPDHWWGAMLAHLAGIPERIGYDLPDVARFLSIAVDPEPGHVVEQNLRLIRLWTGRIEPASAEYVFRFDQADRTYADEVLRQSGVDTEQPIVCIHPGAGTWVKRWHEADWAKVADTLREQLNAAIVFTGGDHEMLMAREITGRMTGPAHVMVGETSVAQMAALYARAQVVLGPDSGPLHLAVAVGTPTVALFGPADPAEFGPWGNKNKHITLTSDIGCRPCKVLDWGGDNPDFHPCLREISVGRVLDAARRAVQYNAESGQGRRGESSQSGITT
jgi:heptosyltransferase-2/heptosyltransferase-3